MFDEMLFHKAHRYQVRIGGLNIYDKQHVNFLFNLSAKSLSQREAPHKNTRNGDVCKIKSRLFVNSQTKTPLKRGKTIYINFCVKTLHLTLIKQRIMCSGLSQTFENHVFRMFVTTLTPPKRGKTIYINFCVKTLHLTLIKQRIMCSGLSQTFENHVFRMFVLR